MPKKKESLVEKTEKAIKKVADKAEGVAEEIIDEIKEVISAEPKKKTAKKKTPSTEKEDKLAKIKEKAAALAKEVKGEEVEIKKSSLKEEPEADTLVPIEDYLKSSIHLGTRAITPDMKPYVYKRRADSLAVFNTALLDEKIREGAEYLAQFSPEDIAVVCKREAGHKAVELFSKITGIRAFTKQYPAGILTNPNLENFFEVDLLLVCDPWMDKNALNDAKRIKIPILGICDTNNYTMNVTKVIPGNNKSAKSLGMIFYLLTKLYVEKRKLEVKVPPVQDFIENWDNLVPPK
jgi:small subunit ribosomal protein S2